MMYRPVWRERQGTLQGIPKVQGSHRVPKQLLRAEATEEWGVQPVPLTGEDVISMILSPDDSAQGGCYLQVKADLLAGPVLLWA